MRTLTKACLLTAIATGLAACPDVEKSQSEVQSPVSTDGLRQQILSANGQSLGVLILSDFGDAGTTVTVNLNDVSPGTHAMHFHEIGNCAAPDFTSAGGHYNPTSAAHGKNMPNGPHAGDMMNIEIASNGTGSVTLTNSRVSIKGENGLPALLDADGTAFIVHAGADDYQSQPSGAAGARIGCAVVGG